MVDTAGGPSDEQEHYGEDDGESLEYSNVDVDMEPWKIQALRDWAAGSKTE